MKKKMMKLAMIALLFFVIFSTITGIRGFFEEEPKEIEFTEFTTLLESNGIQEVMINFGAAKFEFLDNKGDLYVTDNPRLDDFKNTLLLSEVKVTEVIANDALKNIILSIIPLAIYLTLFYFMFRGSMKGTTSIITPKKSKRAESVTENYDNVAGNEEAKRDMMYLVNFLKDPQKYVDAGASLPKGVMLVGPPGTGKTLMARATAGEAGVPFFYANASQFIEMFAGVGAKRVRELFEEAKKNAPCIVFIDEFDAVGGKRGGREGHSEATQTITELLNNLDGFEANTGILVMGATNRLEDLDSAVIRPGRFDRHVTIGLPDKEDRLKILELHAKNKKLSSDVDLEALAKTTIGFAGAGLRTLMNEAAINAVMNDRTEISNADLDKAFYKIIMKGDEKINKHSDPKKTELVAWHEAGHALVAKLQGKSVTKVTIIPSTSGAGGVTFIPPEQMGLMSKKDLLDDIKVSYAGRAAEYILYGDPMLITTGAYSDIGKATEVIKEMIRYYGMTERFGMINLDIIEYKDDVTQIASEMANKLYDETISLLEENKDKLKAIAELLIKAETIDEKMLDEVISDGNVIEVVA